MSDFQRRKEKISEVFPFLNDYYSGEGGYFIDECSEFDIYRDDFYKFLYGGTIMMIEGKSCYHVEDVGGFAYYIDGRNHE